MARPAGKVLTGFSQIHLPAEGTEALLDHQGKAQPRRRLFQKRRLRPGHMIVSHGGHQGFRHGNTRAAKGPAGSPPCRHRARPPRHGCRAGRRRPPSPSPAGYPYPRTGRNPRRTNIAPPPIVTRTVSPRSAVRRELGTGVSTDPRSPAARWSRATGSGGRRDSKAVVNDISRHAPPLPGIRYSCAPLWPR